MADVGPLASAEGWPGGLHVLDADREASWLRSRYSDHQWVTADSFDPSVTRYINFKFRLADGRCLTEVEPLYHVLKEYAWWLRDDRFGKTDTAEMHLVSVNRLKNIAHALTLRGIWSFAHVGPYDIEQLVEDCRYGADAVLKASERVEQYLTDLAKQNDATPLPDRGLPKYWNPGKPPNGGYEKLLHVSKVLEHCNLPDHALRLPRVTWFLNKAALEAGFRLRVAPREELPRLENITAQALGAWLMPLQSLYAMRNKIGRDLVFSFKPFPHGVSKLARQKGVGVARTPIAPPPLALHLMEQATRWVVDYAGPLLRALDAIRDNIEGLGTRNERHGFILEQLPREGAPGCPWPINRFDRQRGSDTSLTASIKFLVTACWIVIATFTARRYEEIMDLEEGCLRGSDEDGWWLNIYIEKTLQQKSDIPVPNVVVRAVEVMRAISKESWEQTQRPLLFQWVNPFSSKEGGALVGFDPRELLDDFADHVGVPPPNATSNEPARPWHWAPHQFRRFFAVLYFYRFEGATLEVLSHHLRHFSLEMTRRYVTQDKEVASIFTDTQWGFAGDLARSIVAGERSVSGGMGKVLRKAAKRLTDIFRRKLRVVEPHQVASAMKLLMGRQGLVVTPKPWVICTCPRTNDAAHRAACRADQQIDNAVTGPNFAAAGPTLCPKCPFSVTCQSRQAFVGQEVAHLESVAATMPRAGTLFGELEAARLLDVQAVEESHFAGATPIVRAVVEPVEAA